MAALKDSPMFQGLPVAQQEQFLDLLGHLGWGKNGLSMAFPYMAPDNNNAFFGDQVAKDFIVNKNHKASKAGHWTPPARTP